MHKPPYSPNLKVIFDPVSFSLSLLTLLRSVICLQKCYGSTQHSLLKSPGLMVDFFGSVWSFYVKGVSKKWFLRKSFNVTLFLPLFGHFTKSFLLHLNTIYKIRTMSGQTLFFLIHPTLQTIYIHPLLTKICSEKEAKKYNI